MTQTLHRDPADPATTAVIQYDRHSYVPGGIVHPSPWSPRLSPQSPDLRPPTEEHATLAELARRAEEQHQADLAAEPMSLAEVMPVLDLPYPPKPPGWVGLHRHPDDMPKPPKPRRKVSARWAWALVLVGASLLSQAAGAGLAVLAVAR